MPLPDAISTPIAVGAALGLVEIYRRWKSKNGKPNGEVAAIRRVEEALDRHDANEIEGMKQLREAFLRHDERAVSAMQQMAANFAAITAVLDRMNGRK
jgi:hypothetical protein